MTASKKVRLIGFDVNGTIFDDTRQFFNAINSIFEKLGRPTMTLDVLQERFGQPWTKIYRESGISENMTGDEVLYRIYNEAYARQQIAEPFDDIRQILEWLRSKGVKIIVVSTQQNSITIPMLERFGLENFFDHFEGGVADKSRALKLTCDNFGIPVDGAAYVGDQEDDVSHAKKAGCISIAFAGGIHSVQRLLKARPDFCVQKHREIKDLPIFG